MRNTKKKAPHPEAEQGESKYQQSEGDTNREQGANKNTRGYESTRRSTTKASRAKIGNCASGYQLMSRERLSSGIREHML